MQLKSDVNGIKPAVITNLTDQEVLGKEVIALGWGYSDMATKSRPPELRKAYLRLLNDIACNEKLSKFYGPDNTVRTNEYCSQANPPVVLTCVSKIRIHL